MPDSHCPTKTLSVHGDMEKRRLFHVPASQFELLEKLLSFGVSLQNVTMSDQFSTTFRHMSDQFSTSFPSHVRPVFDSISIGF